MMATEGLTFVMSLSKITRETGEFYKYFKEALAPFLLQVFEEAITKGHLPPTLRGLIKSRPKPIKGKLNIDNWRLMTLLNNDAKIFASVFAKRLKMGLAEIIDESSQDLCQVFVLLIM